MLGVIVGGALAGSAVALTHVPEVLKETTTTVVEVEKTPDVVLAIQKLAKLESVTYHMEKVVDMAEKERKLYGMVEVKDAILLVAIGEVVAGVDLASISEDDVDSDFENKKVSVRLPAPQVLRVALDEQKTHVFARTTDILAMRHDDLESRARRQAVEDMKKAAVDEGVLQKARDNASGAVKSLLEASGFKEVEVTFVDQEG
jgi:hypothetical protein